MESRLGLVTDESARTIASSSATQSLSSEIAAAVGSGIIGQPPQLGAGPIGGLNPPTAPSGPVGILTPPTPVGGERPIVPIGSPGGPIGISLPPTPVRGPIGLPPLPPRGNMWGGPVGIARPPTVVGGGLGRPIFGGVVNPPVGSRGRLYGPPGGVIRFMPPTQAGGGMPTGPILVSERIGRRAGGGLYGPAPVLTPYRPPVMQGPPGVAGGGLQPPGAAQTAPAVAAVAARTNAANIGGLNRVTSTVTQGQVATAGGVMTAENVQNLLLTRYLNEVYAPVVTQTVGRPTTIVARRTVGNVGTRTVGNVQGGVTISGPQGSVYIPAQQLLAAATG